MPPIPRRANGADGTTGCRAIHRAATMVTMSMMSIMGISISSAILVPNLGTMGNRATKEETTTNRRGQRDFRRSLQLRLYVRYTFRGIDH